MKTIVNRGGGVDRRALDEAIEAIRRGDIIVYPTDTLYALGCDALSNRAVERLCRIKGLNPDKTTLSVVCADLSQAAEYVRIDNIAFRILKRHLPGPFTFVLPAATTLPKVFKGRKTVGVRIPSNDFARAIAEELGHPIMTSSAPEPLPEHGVDLYVESGDVPGTPSTVVDITDSRDPQLLREGAGTFVE